MAFATKQSRMAIVEEVTEGVLEAPSSGADYLAVQDGFSTNTTFETLENAELKASIGKSKTLTGFESPAASTNHYLRHSGTEGQAPQSGFSVLLKAAYGSENIVGVEPTTDVGSTTTLVKVADTSAFLVGQSYLLKHSAFAHEIFTVDSIPNGTDLVPLFALQNAPANGTSMGLPVSYIAQDSGHPSLSVWDYRGNEPVIVGQAGMRVTSLGIEASAGELANMSFSLEGLSSYWNPLQVQAGVNDALDFNDGGLELNATLTAKAYKTPHDLAEEIQTRMAALTLDAITVSYSDVTGKFTIASGGATLNLLWNTGTNTATTVGTLLGFSVAADDTGSTSYVGDSAITLSSPHTPAFDNPGTPLVAKNQRVQIGTIEDNDCVGFQVLNYSLETPITPELSICAESGKKGSVLLERTVSLSGTINLPQYRSDLFRAMAKNEGVGFQYTFGNKDGAGNWIPGECGTVVIRDASVTVHDVTDSNGLVSLDVTIEGYVTTGPETALNLL